MALSRFQPFVFPSIFDEFFEPSTSFFPRELTSFGPTRSLLGGGAFHNHYNQPFMWHHPGYEIHEDDKSYTVSVDVPGIRAEDMKIKVDDNKVLHLSGSRQIKKSTATTTGQEGVASERKFEYRLSMGDRVDLEKLTANLDNGVLYLTAPKKEVPKKKEARTIKITNGPAPKQIQVEKNKA